MAKSLITANVAAIKKKLRSNAQVKQNISANVRNIDSVISNLLATSSTIQSSADVPQELKSPAVNSINTIVTHLRYLNGIGVAGRENTNAPNQPSGADLFNLANTGLFTNVQFIKALGAMLSIDRGSIDNAVNIVNNKIAEAETNNKET